MKLLVVFLAVCGAALAADGTWLTSNSVIDSGRQVDWYTCTAQGNYPDPTTCDHYIACTANNDAYQMECAMGHNGRLHYVRNSGPDEATSYCDYPENVQCDVTPPAPTTTSTQAPTTTSTQAPTTTSTQAPTTTSTQAPTTTSTQASTTSGPTPPGGGPNGTCPDGLKDGDDCNPMVDCNQCGHCDWYFVCVASGDTTGNWRRKECDVKGDPATAIIKVDDKMFFHRGFTSYGGMCAPGIPTELVDDYTSDPNCKLPCLFESVDDCDRAYVYKDPDFTRGIWSDPGSRLLCPEETKWDNAILTCVFCNADDNCNCT